MKNKIINTIFENLHKVSRCYFLLQFPAIFLGIITARFMAEVVAAASEGLLSRTFMLSAVLLGIAIFCRMIQMIGTTSFEKLKSREIQNSRMKLYERFLSGRLSKLYQGAQGDSMEHLTDDLDTAIKKRTELIPGVWAGAVTALCYTVFLVYYSPVTALLLCFMSLLQAVPPLIVKKFEMVTYVDCRKIEAELDDFVIEAYRGFSTIKLYGLKQWWLQRLQQLHKRYVKIGNRTIYEGHGETSLMTLVKLLLQYGTYGVLGLMLLSNWITLEDAVQTIALSGGLFDAVKIILGSISSFAVAKVAEGRMEEWLQTEQPKEANIGAAKLEFQQAILPYPKGAPPLTACFEDGLTIIKGKNGSGKSTLLKASAGLLEPETGWVRLGECDTGQMPENWLPKRVFYLPQQDAALPFSGAELYRMVPGLNPADAEKIADRLGLPHQIMQETPISDLSGGESKKTFLALAFAVNPAILMLDEPTNSLDAQGIEVLEQLLWERQAATLMVTHESRFDRLAQQIYQIHEEEGHDA